MKSDQNSIERLSSPPWWASPGGVLLFIVFPIFLFACFFNEKIYYKIGQPINFVDEEAVAIGIVGLFIIFIGSIFGTFIGAQPLNRVIKEGLSSSHFDKKYFKSLRITAYLGIVAYFIFLGALLSRVDLILSVLTGNRGASAELYLYLGRIPGVTSFIQATYVFFALLAARPLLTKSPVPNDIKMLAILGLGLTVCRAILASERLALLEIVVAIYIVPTCFIWRPTIVRSVLPIIAILFVVSFFSFAEYFRSWQYYQFFYQSFFDFAIERFIAYYSTSINNGAGLYAMGISADVKQSFLWFYKFPIINTIFDYDYTNDFWNVYLQNYASPEFNNPSGAYVAINDFGVLFGLIVNFLYGLLIGVAYASFKNKRVYGLIIYPAIYLGLSDLVRTFYFGGPRLFPIIIIGMIVSMYLGKTGSTEGNR